MSILKKSDFDALYNNPGAGYFPDNTTGDISPADIRQFAKDIEDSVLFTNDNQNTDVNFFEQNDFVLTNLSEGFSSTQSGAGASGFAGSTYGSNSTYHAFGEVSQNTGSTNAGYGVLYKCAGGTPLLLPGNGNTITLSFRLALQQLSNGTNRFIIYAGFGNDITNADHNDGSYFRYCDSENSGKWQAYNIASSSATAHDTGISAAVGYHVFSIVIDPALANVKYYIDGVLVNTNSTHVTSSAIGIVFKIVKLAGTTNCFLNEDWYSLLVTRTTSR